MILHADDLGPACRDGQRHHVAATRDGAALTVYVDGTRQ